MYLRDLAASCLRRWYVVLVCLGAVAALAMFTARHFPPTYEAKASVVLVPPKDPDTPKANRYLSLGGLTQAVDVLTRSLGSDQTHKLVKAKAPSGEYEVVNDWATSAPMLIVTAKGETPAATRTTLTAVLDRVTVNLRELQDSLNIEPEAQITSLPIDREDKPRAVQKTRIRMIVAAVGAGLVASALFVGALDGLLLRWSRRKLAQRADQEQADRDEELFAQSAELEALDRTWLASLESQESRPASGATTRPPSQDRT